MRKRDFSISDDKRISCLSFCSLCIGKKHRFRSLFPFGNLPLKRCFLFFIYDLISRSSIRRTAAFLSPLFSEILRPDRTRSGRCRICGCFQDRSDGSGLRTGRRARSKPSTAHPSQSSEVPDRSVCWRGSRLPLPQFFPGVCRRHGKICKEGIIFECRDLPQRFCVALQVFVSVEQMLRLAELCGIADVQTGKCHVQADIGIGYVITEEKTIGFQPFSPDGLSQRRRCSHRRNGLRCFWRRNCGIPRC